MDEKSAREVSKYATGETIVVEKSTIPVRTAETIKTILESTNRNDLSEQSFHILSNLNFCRRNCTRGFRNPDRVLIGGENQEAIDLLTSIYKRWIPKNKIIETNLWSSELSKLTANAFLAQRISSINSISALCETTGADINEVAKAIGMDSRLGSKFLKSGPGFGGSCFKKDILNLVYICNFYGLKEVANYWEGILKINEWQQDRIAEIIVNNLFGTLSEKKITILGFSFKENTNDTRESPAIRICKKLLNEGATLLIYDPKVKESQLKRELNFSDHEINPDGEWKYCETIDEASFNTDGLVVLTAWAEFKNINWQNLYQFTRKPTWIFDTRNICDLKNAKKAGFKTWSLGSLNN